MLKRSCKKSSYEQTADQVSVPDVWTSAPLDVHSDRLSTAASATSPSVATAAVRVASPTHHVAVKPDAALFWQQASSKEFVDTKPEARLQVTRSSSEKQLDNYLGIRLGRLQAEDFALASALKSRLNTSEQACETLRIENEALKTENSILRKDLDKLKRRMCALVQARIPAEAFGARAWGGYFGEVGIEPALPPDIEQILNSRCPFWPGRRVKDTHLLVLIPSTVNGEAFSLNLLGELIKHPKGEGHSAKYRAYDSDVQEVLGAKSPSKSYWVLMTRDVLEGSRSKKYAYQRALVTSHARDTGLPYMLPSVLEATTAILSHYVRSGERLYSGEPWTYTRCRELIDNEPPVIGGFIPGGIDFSLSSRVHYCDGVACLRKF